VSQMQFREYAFLFCRSWDRVLGLILSDWVGVGAGWWGGYIYPSDLSPFSPFRTKNGQKLYFFNCLHDISQQKPDLPFSQISDLKLVLSV